MSGICGVVFHDRARAVDARTVEPMLAALGGQADGARSLKHAGPAGVGARGFGRRASGTASAVWQGAPVMLAFHGSLYGAWPEGGDGVTALLAAYEREGIDLVRRLAGEFALAVWDGRSETLYLATDRFRVESLVYAVDRETTVFASRLAALEACPRTSRLSLDPTAIVDVVAGSVIPTPRTIFAEARKLPGGQVLTVRGGKAEARPYWSLSFLEPSRAGRRALAADTRRLFREGVSARLQVDRDPARIGAFLSGGIDSSTVTGVLTQVVGGPVKSFSIGFGESRFNEIEYARIAARAFGSPLTEYFVTPEDTVRAIPTLLEGFDEPYANASAVPTFFCARVAREQGVDVLYAGDGGDELFAGNERYATQRLFDYWTDLPRWLREPFLGPLVSGLAAATGLTVLDKARRYIRRANLGYPARLTSYGLFSVVPMADLFDGGFLERVGHAYDGNETIARLWAEAEARTALDRQLYVDLKHAISDNDLIKVTRMTEAAGVTVRFPFLDGPFVDLAVRVPARLKMRGLELRTFFKEAYADLLPLETRRKKKHGFGLPIPVWLRTHEPLNEMMRDTVLGSRLSGRGIFRRATLEAVVERHRTDETSFYGTLLWNLMMLELWLRRQEEGNAVAVPS